MKRFSNRTDAGNHLANVLASDYANKENVVVVALPRGGVPVAYPISKRLGAPLDIVVPRKIGAPHHEEYAIGAITQDKEGCFNEQAIRQLGVSQEYISREVEKQSKEAERRLRVYRGNRPPPNFENKVVILVDDGIATGSTMKAAILSVRNKKPEQIIVAVPVAPSDSLRDLTSMVNRIVCLSTPYPFNAVGNFYDNFNQTEDEEVLKLMGEYAEAH